MIPESPSENDRLLTVPQAAELLQLRCGTIYHLVSQKRLPVIKLSSRCVRFSRAALLLWLEGLTQPASPSSEHPVPFRSSTKNVP